MYKVLIIGAGNIGAFFDNPSSKNILTHAHAFLNHKGFKLIGFVNTSHQKAQKAAMIWGGKAFTTIEQAMISEKIDVASVAVPDVNHYQVLKQLSQFPVKLIFAEKPFTTNLNDALEIIGLCRSKNISLAVNYTRRFVPEFRELKKMIAEKKFGEFVTGTGYYGKGLLHNGSHLIDLLRMLLGKVEIIQKFDSFLDDTVEDPSISAKLTINKVRNFYMLAVNSNFYSIFELDLFFEKKRVRIINSGLEIEISDIQKSQTFNNYKTLTKTNLIHTSLYNALCFAVQNINDHLTNQKKLLCTGSDAFKTMKICLV